MELRVFIWLLIHCSFKSHLKIYRMTMKTLILTPVVGGSGALQDSWRETGHAVP